MAETEYFQKQAAERWQEIMKLSFILGYFKGELKGKGYTEEQVKKLEQDAVDAYKQNWT